MSFYKDAINNVAEKEKEKSTFALKADPQEAPLPVATPASSSEVTVKNETNPVMQPTASNKMLQPEDPNFLYYPEYCRLYFANILLTTKLKHLLTEKDELNKKLSTLESNRKKHEENMGWNFDISEDKKKRHRRTAVEINRHYKCPADICPKSYGSEGSLNQHIKLKHYEYFQNMQQINPNLAMINEGTHSQKDSQEEDVTMNPHGSNMHQKMRREYDEIDDDSNLISNNAFHHEKSDDEDMKHQI